MIVTRDTTSRSRSRPVHEQPEALPAAFGPDDHAGNRSKHVVPKVHVAGIHDDSNRCELTGQRGGEVVEVDGVRVVHVPLPEQRWS